jgi:hypothetical protein
MKIAYLLLAAAFLGGWIYAWTVSAMAGGIATAVIVAIDLYMRHGRAMRAAHDAHRRAEAVERRVSEVERRIAEVEIKTNAAPQRSG